MRNPEHRRKRAYGVHSKDRACVVFAANNSAARRLGTLRMECAAAEIKSCALAPEFDKYLNLGNVPPNNLLEGHGWWQFCARCETAVSNSTPSRVWDGAIVYCDAHCLAHDMNVTFDALSEKTQREAAESLAIELARERFPGLTNVRAMNCDAKTLVFFDFPGCTSSAEWVAGHLNARVGRNDTDAWEAFRASHNSGDIGA